MDKKYIRIKKYVEGAGFFTGEYAFDCIVCASKRWMHAGRAHFGGKSFWVAERKDKWIVSYWDVDHFLIPNPAHVAELCVAILTCPERFVDEQTKKDFSLIDVSPEQLDSL